MSRDSFFVSGAECSRGRVCLRGFEQSPLPSLPAGRAVFSWPSLPAGRDVFPRPSLLAGRAVFPRPRLPAGRDCFLRPSLPAGRDFGPVRTCGAFPPTAARRAPPVHEATGGYAVRSPCPSGIPRPRHNAVLPWSGGIAPVLTLWLHRFAILGLKSRIDARIAPVLTLWLHRFSSLGLKSRIDARFALVLTFWLH